MELHDADTFLRAHRQAAIAVPRADGTPHVSRIVQLFDGDTSRISLTDTRVKTRLLREAGRASLHVRGASDWEWVTLEATAALSDVATESDDAVVDELLKIYTALAGEHPDPDEFREAMVGEQRCVLTLTPVRVYGQLPG